MLFISLTAFICICMIKDLSYNFQKTSLKKLLRNQPGIGIRTLQYWLTYPIYVVEAS